MSHTIIVGDQRGADSTFRGDVLVVTTKRDILKTLEKKRGDITAVVLTGSMAKDRELATFLHDAYPTLEVVSGRHGEEPDTYLPPFA